MTAQTLLLAMALMGVDVGWQPANGGGLEYVIQIEPQLVGNLNEGVTSQIPPQIRGQVTAYRIQVGQGELPREQATIPPPGTGAAVPGRNQIGGFAPNTSLSDPNAGLTTPPTFGSPMPGAFSSASGSPTSPNYGSEGPLATPIAPMQPMYGGGPDAMRPSNLDAYNPLRGSTGNPVPVGNPNTAASGSYPSGYPYEGPALGNPTASTTPSMSPPPTSNPNYMQAIPGTANERYGSGDSFTPNTSGVVADPVQPIIRQRDVVGNNPTGRDLNGRDLNNRDFNDRDYNNSELGSRPAQGMAGSNFNNNPMTPSSFRDGNSLATDETVGKPAITAPPVEQWMPLSVSILFLVGSLAANVYLGWTWYITRMRYRDLVYQRNR